MKNKLILFVCLTALSQFSIGLPRYNKQSTIRNSEKLWPYNSIKITNLNFYKVNNTFINFNTNLISFNFNIYKPIYNNSHFFNNPKEKLFFNTLKQVVYLLQKKDSAALATYIHHATGVYLIYRPGASDIFTNSPSLNFNESIYPSISVSPQLQAQSLNYEILPTFDCATESWSKIGCYTDTSSTDHLLSGIARALRDIFEVDWISENTIATLKQLEDCSRRIVIVNNTGESLVIYLSYIKKKWYLTIVDLVSNDCSA